MPTRVNSLSQLKGLSDKRACLVATVGNIAFTGITQIDGVTLSNDDRVLVWQQSIPSQNGIYILSGSTNLVRALDSKNVNDFVQGTQYFVVSGNTYSETLFYLKNKVTTLGIDNIIIDIFGGLNGTSGTSGTSGSNAGITSYTNPADNRVITSVSASAINAEANLTFDGSVFDVNTTAAFKLPVGTTAERPSSPTTGSMRYNTTTLGLEIYLGGRWQQVSVADYPIIVQYLVVAGGGGGGASAGNQRAGGGGGAGGYRTSIGTSGQNSASESTLVLNRNLTYTVTVGAGGSGGLSTSASGSLGSNSTFASISAIGGGGGGPGLFSSGNSAGQNGGSGGGAGGSTTQNNGGTGTITQGFAGGNNFDGSQVASGGGGGSGGAGGGATTSNIGGASGVGLSNSITGIAVTRAIGGPGRSAGNAENGTNAASNLGNGAIGGKGENSIGGNGGSGVVIIRYSNAEPNLNLSVGIQYVTPGSSGATTTNITSNGVYAPSYTPEGFKVYEFRGTGNIPLNISWIV